MSEILEWLGKVNLLRYTQRAGLQDERQRLEEQANQPVLGPKAGIQNPTAIKQEIKKIDRQLSEQVPREITTEERDLLASKKRELETEVVIGMPTQEEMRRNPPGTVHRHMQWEKRNKAKLNLLKNILIQLEPKSEDPDLANLERLRPQQATPGTPATFMINAQIPGHHALSAQAKENWPSEMPAQGTVNSPLRQAKKREMTPEQRKEWGRKMKDARKAKRRT